MDQFYQGIQIVYWLTLSIWLGSSVFLALAAPVVFRVVRRLDVRVPRYSSPNLADEQVTIVAGEIVGALLARLGQIQMVCAAILLPMLLAQFITIDLTGANLTAALIRDGLWALATLLLAYQWRIHFPRTWAIRQAYLDHADEPEVANVLKDQFDREHRRSGTLFQITVFALLGLVVISGNISPRRAHTPAAEPAPVTPK